MHFLSYFWLVNAKMTSPNAYTWIKMQKSGFKMHKSGLKTQFSGILSKKRDSSIKSFWCLKTKIMISMQCDQHIRAKRFISKQKRFQNLKIYEFLCKKCALAWEIQKCFFGSLNSFFMGAKWSPLQNMMNATDFIQIHGENQKLWAKLEVFGARTCFLHIIGHFYVHYIF